MESSHEKLLRSTSLKKCHYVCDKNKRTLGKKEIVPQLPAREETTGKPSVSSQFLILPESEYRLGLLLLLVYWSVSFKITLSIKSLC